MTKCKKYAIIKEKYIGDDVLSSIKNKEQLCFSCKNACGNCSWSKNFTPVEGWTAEKIVLPREVETYAIYSCPEYVYDGICARCKYFDVSYKVPELWNLKCPKCSKLGNFESCRNYKNIYL